MLDAIVRSIYRQFVSHRYLLEWETAADTEKRLDVSFKTMFRSMWSVILFVLLAGLTTSLFFHREVRAICPVGDCLGGFNLGCLSGESA